MSGFDARIVLRPRSLDETFDLALAYLRVSARQFLPLFAGLSVFATGIVFLISWALDLSLGARLCVAILLTPVLERVVTVYAGRHLFQSSGLVGAALWAVLKQLPLIVALAAFNTLPLLLMAYSRFEEEALLGFGIMLGMIWPFLVVVHYYLGEVSHLEQLPLSKAPARARALVGYRYGRVFGLLAVGFVVRLLFALGTYSTGLFIMGFVLQFEEVSTNLGEWAALAGYLAAGPYLALVRLFDYVDARTRREGWDIQVRFHAIAQRERARVAERSAA